MEILDSVTRRERALCGISAPDVGPVVDAHAVVVAEQAWYLSGVR
jgi:hypothetical protein